MSRTAWVLLALLLVGGLGVGGWIQHQKRVTRNVLVREHILQYPQSILLCVVHNHDNDHRLAHTLMAAVEAATSPLRLTVAVAVTRGATVDIQREFGQLLQRYDFEVPIYVALSRTNQLADFCAAWHAQWTNESCVVVPGPSTVFQKGWDVELIQQVQFYTQTRTVNDDIRGSDVIFTTPGPRRFAGLVPDPDRGLLEQVSTFPFNDRTPSVPSCSLSPALWITSGTTFHRFVEIFRTERVHWSGHVLADHLLAANVCLVHRIRVLTIDLAKFTSRPVTVKAKNNPLHDPEFVRQFSAAFCDRVGLKKKPFETEEDDEDDKDDKDEEQENNTPTEPHSEISSDSSSLDLSPFQWELPSTTDCYLEIRPRLCTGLTKKAFKWPERRPEAQIKYGSVVTAYRKIQHAKTQYR